jgi:hypothetical protein
MWLQILYFRCNMDLCFVLFCFYWLIFFDMEALEEHDFTDHQIVAPCPFKGSHYNDYSNQVD